jgi:putative ABC transport system ATP-binding protein
LGQRVERLSAGERQRVALARAFAVAPKLLLIDEPTSRLDRDSAELVTQVVRDITTELGICTVCATHDDRMIAAADVRLNLDVAG